MPSPLDRLSDTELAARLSRNRKWRQGHPNDPNFVSVVAYGARLEAELSRRRHVTALTATLAGTRASGFHAPLSDRAIAQTFLDPRYGGRADFIGRLGEVSLQRDTWRGFFMRDLNYAMRPGEQAGFFPLFDFLDRHSGALTQVKISTRGEAGRMKYYDPGFKDATGYYVGMQGSDRARTFDNAAERLQEVAGPLTTEDIVGRGRLAINADDVVRFRERMTQRITTLPENHGRLLNSILVDEPVTVPPRGSLGARTFTSFEQIEAALAQGTISPLERNLTIAQLAQQASERVGPAGRLTTEAASALVEYRGRYGWNGQEVAIDRVPSAINAETVMQIRAGGGVRGVLVATRQGATRGAGAGAVIGIILDTGVILFDDRKHPEFAKELARSGFAAGAGGAIGGGVETSLGRVPLRGVRGLRGPIGGVVAAPVVVALDMGLDSESHTSTDYAARMTRATAGAAYAGILTWALIGSAGGPLGMVAGLILGIAFAAFFDNLVGEDIESGVREVLGDDERALNEALGVEPQMPELGPMRPVERPAPLDWGITPTPRDVFSPVWGGGPTPWPFTSPTPFGQPFGPFWGDPRTSPGELLKQWGRELGRGSRGAGGMGPLFQPRDPSGD